MVWVLEREESYRKFSITQGNSGDYRASFSADWGFYNTV